MGKRFSTVPFPFWMPVFVSGLGRGGVPQSPALRGQSPRLAGRGLLFSPDLFPEGSVGS